MIRLLVEDVTLIRDHARVRLHVRFRGGRTESLEVTPPPKSWQKRLTSPEAIAEIDRLLDDHTRNEIVEIVNDLGYRSGDGLRFTRQIVKNVCASYRLKSRKRRLREAGLVSRRELAERLGVQCATITRWQCAGRLVAQRCNDKNEYLFEVPVADAVANLRGTAASERPPRVRSSSTNQRGAV